MNGPSAGYLADIWAPFTTGANAAGIAPAPAPPPPSPDPGPAPSTPPPPLDPFTAGAIQAGLTPTSFAPEPEKLPTMMGPTTGAPITVPGVPAPPPPPPKPPMGPPSPPPPAPPTQHGSFGPSLDAFAPPTPVGTPEAGGDAAHGDAFPVVSVGGSHTIPAHEVDLRGPTLRDAQTQAAAANENAIHNNAARTQAAVEDEYAMALQQERDARMREAAIQQSIAERDEEMAQRQAEFDRTVQQMGKIGTTDRDRFWGTRTTGQKIAGVLEMMVAGFRNAPSMVTKRIDEDVRSQEFAYYAARDRAQAKQTAFSLAMNKYQNADAARAAATAAGIDVTQARLAQMAAKWKGTDAGNNAEAAIARLQDEKVLRIKEGMRFVLPQQTGPSYIDPETGLPYDLAGAHKLAEAWRANRQAKQMKVADTGGQILVEGVRAQNKAAEDNAKKSANAVVLPSGETFIAPTEADAKQIREGVASLTETRRLVNTAKEIRASSGFRFSPSDRNRLNQIQADLLTQFAVQKKLGALSDKDYDLAVQGTADLFQYGSGAEARLDQLDQATTGRFQNMLRTYPGATATPRASGQMPASTQIPKK